MALSPTEQFQKILASAQHLLIIIPQETTPQNRGDIIAASYGLALTCEAIGVEATIAYDDTAGSREMYNFLPQPSNIRHTLSHTRDFVLTFKTAHNDVKNIRSERTEDMVEIRVTPQNGTIDARDFSFGLAEFPYSAMIAVGAPDKESFGPLALQMPDLFYDLPIINIDHGGANEQYGHINIVTLTASSVSEVMAKLCYDTYQDAVTRDVAQCFLAGIIVATDSFRAKHTTPNALTVAGNMIERGANQQAIIDELYSSQPLALLKLWGKALTKLTTHAQGKIVTAIITADDFTSTNTTHHHIPSIITKIRNNHTKADYITIIYQQNNSKNSHTDENQQFYSLIDTAQKANLSEDVFGPREKSGFYEITFRVQDADQATQDLVTLLQKNLDNSI
jgi:hypothetical protein